ncbi:MAG: tetratricopeptide repeat protein [Desulfovibrionaceae bacterium]|nr:tetratricopeptide repeat protein [Desulfovibrionaceae bacterium]
MGNLLKKTFLLLCLGLLLGLFCFIWGCFLAPGQNKISTEWTLGPGGEEIYNLLLLEQALRSDNIEEVIRAARELTGADPSEETFIDAAGALMLRGAKEEALEIARNGRLHLPESSRITLIYAEALIQAGQMEEGAGMFLTYARANPRETHIIMRLAEMFIRLREFAQANEALNLIPSDALPSELDPSWPAWSDTPARKTPYYLYVKAKAMAGLNNLQDAEALFKRAVDKDPKFMEAWAELAFLYEKNKRPAEALEIYNRLLDMDRSNPAVWIRVVYAELQLGQVENAYAAVKLGPPTLSFLMQAGQLFSSYKEWLLAEQIYLKAASLPGADDEVFIYLFATAHDGGNFDRAINYLDMISPESPVYEKAVLNKIQAFLEEGRTQEAMAAVDEGLEKFPLEKVFWQGKASLLHLMSKYDEAEAVLLDALERFDHDPELMFSLGALYDQAGRKAEAMRTMEEIVRQNPGNSDALNYIGYTLADRGVELERAHKLILQALEGDPENHHIIDSLAWVQYRLGLFDEAYATILEAVEYSPLEPEIWDHYGDIAVKLNRPDEAAKAYARALELDPDNAGEIQKKLDDLRE